MAARLLARGAAAVMISAAALTATASEVGAHPRLLEAEPEPASTVTGPLAEVVVRFDEAVDWSYSKIDIEDVDGNSLLGGTARLEPRTATLPVAAGATGAMRVFWRAVGDDAHPVIGAFVLGVRGPAGSGDADLDAALGRLSGALGEGRTGPEALAWAIRGGRSLEITLLYLVLGILLLRTLVLRGRLAPARPRPGAATLATVGDDRGYRTLVRVGAVAAVAMPALFVLYAARLQSVLTGIGFRDVAWSSLGQTWTTKTVLWMAIVVASVYGLRRHPAGSRQHDLLLLSLAAAIAVAFGNNTHAAGESPGLVWGTMMWGHVMVTAFWAGGLVALLLLVFPGGDPERIWRSVGRFSAIMTATVVMIVGSGVLMLLQLSGNWKSMWCSDFGLVAGFKMAVVAIALTIGAVNNRVVAYQRKSLESPGRRFRPRQERSIPRLRRLVAAEAAVLGVAVLLSGALGETELPAVFEGNYYPLDLQETVRPGLFGSGCSQ